MTSHTCIKHLTESLFVFMLHQCFAVVCISSLLVVHRVFSSAFFITDGVNTLIGRAELWTSSSIDHRVQFIQYKSVSDSASASSEFHATDILKMCKEVINESLQAKK